MAALAFEIQHRVDHMFNDARARDLAVLGDMAHDHDGDAALLGKRHQLMRRGADLTDGPRCGLDRVGPQGLDRIDDRQIGFFGIQRGQNIAQRGLGPQPHRRLGQP